jgi:hypothetical protein
VLVGFAVFNGKYRINNLMQRMFVNPVNDTSMSVAYRTIFHAGIACQGNRTKIIAASR